MVVVVLMGAKWEATNPQRKQTPHLTFKKPGQLGPCWVILSERFPQGSPECLSKALLCLCWERWDASSHALKVAHVELCGIVKHWHRKCLVTFCIM